MSDPRGRGFNRGRGAWHAQTSHQQAAPLRRERLSDHGWEDRGESLPCGRAVFNLGDHARVWRGGPDGPTWAGEVLINGEWRPFEAEGKLGEMTRKVNEAAGIK